MVAQNTHQGVRVQILMAVQSREHESLLDAFALGEAGVVSDRPTISEKLVWLDTCLGRRVSTPKRDVVLQVSMYGPTSAASLITRSSRLMISSHSARSSTEICGWTPFGSFSRVSTAQSWPCSDTIALYAVLRAQSIGVSFRRRPAISTPTISSTYPVTASTNWAQIRQSGLGVSASR